MFEVAEPIYCCITVFLHLILTFDPVTLKNCSVSPVTWWNSVPDFNAIEQSAAELMRFQYFWPYDLEHVLCVALGSGIIFTKFDLRQPIRAWIIAFLMLIPYVTLWPFDLESSWYIKRHVIKVCSKFERNRAHFGWIIDNVAKFCARFTFRE